MRPPLILALVLLAPLLSSPAVGAAADDPRPIVPASEIQAKIERGEPVAYDGVIVVGDLDISGLDLPTKHVERTEYEIYILHLIEEAKVIESSIIIKNSEIRGTVSFSGSQFNGIASFWGVQFSGNADFSGAQFNGISYFYSAKFSGDADFSWAEFRGYVFFNEAQFDGNADFSWAEFSGYALFNEAQFNGNADFSWAEFSVDAFFTEVQFSGNAYFSTAQFRETSYFNNALFNNTNLIFNDAKIYILHLSDSTLENGSTISLERTDYERMYVHWDQIKDGFVYNGEAYLALVRNFKTIEYFEDADSCYYQYRRERQSMRSWLERAKYVDILAWLTCGYGVRPGYTLGLGFFSVLTSSLYYWRTGAIRRLKGNEEESANFWDAFYFSTMTFTTVGYGDWYPLDRHRKVVMIEGIIGWLTLSLFLVTLANVIIR
jgi:uncharacterized protein YjbI with pentapeptide repeats